MTLILASRPNAYSGSPLDRAGHLRDNSDWIEAALASPDAIFAPVWRARSLMRGVAEGRPEAVFLSGIAASVLRVRGWPDGGIWAFLGMQGPQPVFAIDISPEDDPLPLLPEEMGQFTDLRQVAGLLPPEEASVLAHARGLMHWRTKHRFCGVCGAACTPRSAGHSTQCTGCRALHFPRTDPAVLGHSKRFPNSTMYSTLAGFVEPGETLEEAVAREVLEESGVRVDAVQYHSSQPWPFPASIMLGFYARALTEAITIDPEELTDARWFSRDDLRRHRDLGFQLPRADSIARRLIEDWLAVG